HVVLCGDTGNTDFLAFDSVSSVFSKLPLITDGASNQGRIFYAKIHKPGPAYTVNLRMLSAVDFSRMSVFAITTTTGEMQVVANSENFGGSSVIDAGTLTTAYPSVSVMHVGMGTAGTQTPGTDWVEDFEGGSYSAHRVGDGPGVIDPVCTSTVGSAWNATAASFAEAELVLWPQSLL
ncbi:MAG: hypothetical protein ACRCZI_04070, partial [Cetobacterium sp.]